MEDLILLNNVTGASRDACLGREASLEEELSLCKQNQDENQGEKDSLAIQIELYKGHAKLLREENQKLTRQLEIEKNNIQKLEGQGESDEWLDEGLEEQPELEDQASADQPEGHPTLDGSVKTQRKDRQPSSTSHNRATDRFPATTTDRYDAMRVDLQATHLRIKAHITSQAEKHAKLESDLATHKKKIEAHDEEVRSLEDKLTTLNRKIASLQNQNSNLQANNTQLEVEKSDLADQYRELEDKYNQLDKDHKKLEEDYSKLEEEDRALQREKSQLEQNKKQLEQEKSKLEEDKSKLEEQITGANATITYFSKEMSALSSQIKNATGICSSNAQELHTRFDTVSRRRREVEQKQADDRVELCSKQAAIDKIQAEVKNKDKKFKKALSRRKRVEDRLKIVRNKLNDARTELKKSNDLLQQHQLVIDDIESHANTIVSNPNSRHSRRSVVHHNSSNTNKGVDGEEHHGTDPYEGVRKQFESDLNDIKDVVENSISKAKSCQSIDKDALNTLLHEIIEENISDGITSHENSSHPVANGSDQPFTAAPTTLAAICSGIGMICNTTMAIAHVTQDSTTDNSTESNNHQENSIWPYVISSIGGIAIGMGAGIAATLLYVRHKFQKNGAKISGEGGSPDSLHLLAFTSPQARRSNSIDLSSIDNGGEAPFDHCSTDRLIQGLSSVTKNRDLDQTTPTDVLTRFSQISSMTQSVVGYSG